MIRTVRGHELGVQVTLWKVGSPPPDPAGVKPLERYLPVKPRGGFWTSSYQPQTIGGWAEWCRGEGFACGEHDMWLLMPEPDALAVDIDSYEDLAALHAEYGKIEEFGPGLTEEYPDWEALSKVYAGVHLTDEGQWRTRLSHPLNLYGWDCESTLWFRWAFVKVEHAGVVTIEERGYSFEDDARGGAI